MYWGPRRPNSLKLAPQNFLDVFNDAYPTRSGFYVISLVVSCSIYDRLLTDKNVLASVCALNLWIKF